MYGDTHKMLCPKLWKPSFDIFIKRNVVQLKPKKLKDAKQSFLHFDKILLRTNFIKLYCYLGNWLNIVYNAQLDIKFGYNSIRHILTDPLTYLLL